MPGPLDYRPLQPRAVGGGQGGQHPLVSMKALLDIDRAMYERNRRQMAEARQARAESREQSREARAAYDHAQKDLTKRVDHWGGALHNMMERRGGGNRLDREEKAKLEAIQAATQRRETNYEGQVRTPRLLKEQQAADDALLAEDNQALLLKAEDHEYRALREGFMGIGIQMPEEYSGAASASALANLALSETMRKFLNTEHGKDEDAAKSMMTDVLYGKTRESEEGFEHIGGLLQKNSLLNPEGNNLTSEQQQVIAIKAQQFVLHLVKNGGLEPENAVERAITFLGSKEGMAAVMGEGFAELADQIFGAEPVGTPNPEAQDASEVGGIIRGFQPDREGFSKYPAGM